MEYRRSKRGRTDALLMGYKRCRRGRAGDALILRLPGHLISDILSRLPVESVGCCKCVCKTLEKILRDPYFAELHLVTAIKADPRLIIQNQNNPSYLFLFHMPDPENTSPPCPWKKLAVPSIISKLEPIRARLLGACNGLICLEYSTEEQHMIYICNPVLGEFMLLPQAKKHAYTTMFGFCAKTKQYKVIQFSRPVIKTCRDKLTFYSSSEVHTCEIYTVGTKNWRMIENVPLPKYMNSTYLNRNLHWVSECEGASDMICSFNLEAEQVSLIPLPLHFYQRQVNTRVNSLQVGVIDGLLCFSYLLDHVQLEDRFESFVMKDYAVKHSWTKKATIDLNFLQISRFNDSWTKQLHIHFKFTSSLNRNRLMRLIYHYNPSSIKFLDNGALLLRYLTFPIMYYNPQKGTASDLMELAWKGRVYERVHGSYDSFCYRPSFISLAEIAKGENLEVLKLEKLENISSYDRVRKSRTR